jgi:hypothetical protein
MKGLLRLKMQLVTMNSVPKKRRVILLCPFSTNKANKVLQEAQDSIAKMMITMHMDLMKVVKSKIQHAINMWRNNDIQKWQLVGFFLQHVVTLIESGLKIANATQFWESKCPPLGTTCTQ